MSATATPDGLFNIYFTRCGPGWNGGDSTYSVQLSDSTVAWLFSDSYVGRVDANGIRQSPSFVSGNVLITQDLRSGAFMSYVRQNGKVVALPSSSFFKAQSGPLTYDATNCSQGSPTAADAYFTAPSCKVKPCRLWAGDMVVEGGNLRVFLRRYGGNDGQSPAWDGTFIGSVPAGSLTSPATPVVAPSPAGIMYGSAILPDVVDGSGTYTYIYGAKKEPACQWLGTQANNCLYLARVPKGSLTTFSKWQYWGRIDANKTGWTTDATKSTALGLSVPEEFSVTRIRSCGNVASPCYVLLGHSVNGVSNSIVAYYSKSPAGPWSNPVPVAITPETQGHTATYNSHAHPEFSNDASGLLVSYNVMNTDNKDRVTDYLPRFIRVRINW